MSSPAPRAVSAQPSLLVLPEEILADIFLRLDAAADLARASAACTASSASSAATGPSTDRPWLSSSVVLVLKVLEKYFPEVSRLSPSIGRQGKALRRQRLRKVVESQMVTEKIDDLSCSTLKEQNLNTDDVDSVICGVDARPDDIHHGECRKFALFKDFTLSGLGRLGCGSVEDMNLLEIWKDVQPFSEYIGPFWCLRAALGPLIETYILLDRLLFLQEQSNLAEALLFPLFDPTVSPRNMAIIAWKLSANSSEA